MAPVRPSSKWRAGGFAAREEGTPQVASKNHSGKRRTWRPSHQQAFPGSVREGMSEDSSAEGRGCLLRVCPEKSFGTSSGSLLRPGKPFLSPLSPLASQSFAWENGTVLSTESYRKHGASRGSRLRYPDRFVSVLQQRKERWG
ncbi:hypothetical protein NN561_003411 [Cricetulus griseus]